MHAHRFLPNSLGTSAWFSTLICRPLLTCCPDVRTNWCTSRQLNVYTDMCLQANITGKVSQHSVRVFRCFWVLS